MEVECGGGEGSLETGLGEAEVASVAQVGDVDRLGDGAFDASPGVVAAFEGRGLLVAPGGEEGGVLGGRVEHDAAWVGGRGGAGGALRAGPAGRLREADRDPGVAGRVVGRRPTGAGDAERADGDAGLPLD